MNDICHILTPLLPDAQVGSATQRPSENVESLAEGVMLGSSSCKNTTADAASELASPTLPSETQVSYSHYVMIFFVISQLFFNISHDHVCDFKKYTCRFIIFVFASHDITRLYYLARYPLWLFVLRFYHTYSRIPTSLRIRPLHCN